jgi:hypothetical protein
MELNIEDIKTIAQISKPIIDPIINSLIKPQIGKLNSWLKKKNIDNKVEDNFWENKFEKYLQDLYNNSLFLTTLVFPNQRTKIKDLYVPLTIIASDNYKRHKINKFDFKLFDTYDKIIISDYAGMGKSTLMKWIAISILEQNKSVPILIELRKINDENTIIDEIFNQLNPIDKEFDKELVFRLLNLGFFTILLDGFDEIPFDIQDKVIIQLRDFIKKTNKNKFILTSRPESSLSSFSDFQLFQIKPLEENEAFSLIYKLDNLSKVKFGEKLVSEIKEKNTQVKEFLTNPFLVSLLYKSYTYNKDIPSKKATFYEEVYGCLFKHHDLSKEGFKRPKKSRLDIFDFELILRDIAFETSKLGAVIYTKDELIKHIIKSKNKNVQIEFKEQNFYDDLTTTVPLFNIEGLKIKWAHKSIQDYFTAKYISNHTRKEEIIDRVFKSNKFQYLNIIDLLYELEPKIFRKIIIKPILEDFISFYSSQFLEKLDIPVKLINERVGLCFSSEFCILNPDKEIGFDKARGIFAKTISADDSFITGATFHHGEEYYTMSETSLKKQIIKILRLKSQNLFIEEKPSVGSIRSIISEFELNKPYIINDNLKEVFNKKENFMMVNGEMSSRIMDRRDKLTFNLDFKKCKKSLDLINKEILNDDSQNLLDDI